MALLDNIGKILNIPTLSDDVKLNEILKELSAHPNAIPMMLKMLNNEREEKNEMVKDLNLEVGRLDIMIKHPKMGGKTKDQRDVFRKECIDNLYKKWDGKLSHPFKNQIT